MIFELIDLYKIRKAILYLFAVGVTLWLQGDVFSRVAVWGVKPLIVPVTVVAVGLLEGGVWGGVAGIFAGVVTDYLFLDSTVTFLILLAAVGFFSGVLAEYFLNRRFMSYMLLTAGVLLAVAGIQSVPTWIFRGASLWSLLPVVLLQALLGTPFGVPAYFACKAISGRRRL